MKVTIKEVAKQAGVSVKTVSRVINNQAFVRDELRARVAQAVEELGYVANISAQRLASGRSYTIGLVYHNASWYYIGRVLQGVLDTGRQAGYSVILHPFDSSQPLNYQEVIDLVSRRSVDGFIFTPPSDNSPSLLSDLQAARIPFVRLTPNDRLHPSPYVTATDQQGAQVMTRYLLSQGHRRIGFIKGPPEQRAAHDRFKGFKAALAEHGLDYDSALVTSGDDHFTAGVNGAQALLKLELSPTAIFANNDEMAAGVITAICQQGLRVPDDISVAGFDDIPLASTIWPPLTTIRQPIYRLAEVATNLLISLLNGEEPDEPYYEIPTELVVRKSVCTVRPTA